MENHIEQHEDDEKDDGQNELQALFRSQLELVFARPLIGVARGQLQLLAKHLARLVYETTVIGSVQVNVDVAGQLAIFVADHGRTAREGHFGHFGNGNLGAGRRRNQNSVELFDIVAEVALVAYIDRIASASFNIFGNIHASNTRLDRLLNVRDGQAVLGRLRTIDFNIDVEALRN